MHSNIGLGAMNLVNDIDLLRQLVENQQFCLIFIQAPDCGLCSVILDKVERVAAQFDKLSAARVELHVTPQVTGEFLVATAPTVLLFVGGKEVYRAGTFIDVHELENELEKWISNIT